jgi:hypothetical protein
VVHAGAQAAGSGVERGAAGRGGAAAGAREGADVATVVVVGVADSRVGAAVVQGGVGGVQDLPTSPSPSPSPSSSPSLGAAVVEGGVGGVQNLPVSLCLSLSPSLSLSLSPSWVAAFCELGCCILRGGGQCDGHHAACMTRGFQLAVGTDHIQDFRRGKYCTWSTPSAECDAKRRECVRAGAVVDLIRWARFVGSCARRTWRTLAGFSGGEQSAWSDAFTDAQQGTRMRAPALTQTSPPFPLYGKQPILF